jgi:hypothetical protein
MKNAILVFAVLLGTFAQAQSTSKKQLQKKWTRPSTNLKSKICMERPLTSPRLRVKNIDRKHCLEMRTYPQYKDLEKSTKSISLKDLWSLDSRLMISRRKNPEPTRK